MGPQTSAQGSATKSNPVMDVVVPAPASSEPLATPPPAESQPKSAPVATKGSGKPAAIAAKGAAKSSQGRGNSVALAVVATVIIVLGLGALTVLAYLKQTHSL